MKMANCEAQGASASHQAAAKGVDAIGKFPGNKAEDSDATSAYTQVDLDEVEELIGKKIPETWITLPKRFWPNHWHRLFPDPEDPPMVKLQKNLYGHKLAGLYWELWCTKKEQELGFHKVPGWECLFYHPKEKLFLSICVDGFQMAGPIVNVDDMWKKLRAKMDLDNPAPSGNNTYIGRTQRDVEIKYANRQIIYRKMLRLPNALDEEQETEEHDPQMANVKETSRINKLQQIKNKRTKQTNKRRGPPSQGKAQTQTVNSTTSR